MSEPIRAALTAEEWEEQCFSEQEDDALSTVVDLGNNILTVTPLVLLPEDKGTWRVGLGERQRIDIERKHSLAALALYGQSFGFSHEDVRALRNWEDEIKFYDVAKSIADRIQALLPQPGPVSTG
jgi:hypothetical protein